MNNVAGVFNIAGSTIERASGRTWLAPSLFWLCFAFAAIVYFQLHFWNWPEKQDSANWDYFAQVVARGGVPYKDVVNIKTPLSAYIGAAAILVGKPFGLRDIYAIRITYLLLASLTRRVNILDRQPVLRKLQNRPACGVDPPGCRAIRHLEHHRRSAKDADDPFRTGLALGDPERPSVHRRIFGMLSALSWQPGLLFVGAAGLAFSKYLTSWRTSKLRDSLREPQRLY
ncbi:MAG TPA: hypothetical protein VNS63_26625 [Blastocatellia bacterium]|nr:hypothetical protein [Blastocatellia bacterium]